jgi:squalene synthase HpnC
VVDSSLAAAYAHCAAIARRHYENFPVASWLLPRAMRPHIAAIYAFARTADDFADQPDRDPNERLQLLDDWSERLHRTVRGDPGSDPVFVALGATMRQCDLPVQLFEDLLSAFRQDVTVHRYQNWEEVLDYCRRSANPVGRLVLRVARVRDPETESRSDALCTALQLANFWQDFGRDWHDGRLYVPVEEVRKAGAVERDLNRRQLTAQWKNALQASVIRTRSFFDAGRPVADAVHGRLRFELRATWLGGSRILDKIAALDYDTLASRPTLTPADIARIAVKTLVWKNRSSAN